jgi:hypothetical protein
MRYLLLINKNEAKYRELSDEERRALHARYEAYGRKMMAAGILKGGAMLEPTDTATTVRVRNGQRLITDGPFAETNEQVAGIGIIDVDNLDQALEWAAGHPDAEWASVEVRPIVPWEKPG